MVSYAVASNSYMPFVIDMHDEPSCLDMNDIL